MYSFKWQSLVGKCQMDFPIATWIPSLENSFWYTKSWGAEEPSHIHTNALVMLEVALISH